MSNYKLSEITTKISDGLHATPKYNENGTIPFVNGNNIVGSKIMTENNTKYICRSEYSKYKQFYTNNSVIISLNGTIGNVGIVGEGEFLFGKSIGYINCDSKLNNLYLMYFLQTIKVQNIFLKEITGSTIKNLSLKTLKNVEIKLHSESKQIKIGNLLSTMDKLIEDKENIILNYTLQLEYFTNYIFDNWFSKDKYIDLKSVFFVTSTGLDKKINPTETTVKMVNYMDVYKNRIVLDELKETSGTSDKINQNKLLKGDILITPTSETPDDIFNSAVFEIESNENIVYSYHLTCLRSIDNVNPYFYKYYFDTRIFRKTISKYATGSTRFTLSKKDIEHVKIVTCDINEQEKIANLLSSMDKIIDLHKQELEQLKLKKKFYLNKIFN
jgi:type I restriction enzyme S subunit